MTFFQAFILGIVQGLTEFLPVSSSGHLVVLPKIFGWGEQPLVFDTTMHLATALALIVYFRKDLFLIVKSFDKGLFTTKTRFAWILVAGTIPAGILGVVFGDVIESAFRSVESVVVFLTLGSLLMLAAEMFGRKKSADIDFKKGVITGFFQALALFPGVSRSGSTISGGMFLGLDRVAAARFSFFLSIPIILAAGVFQLFDSSITELNPLVLLTGFISAFGSGLLAISFLLRFVRSNPLYVFVAYRVVLAILLVFSA